MLSSFLFLIFLNILDYSIITCTVTLGEGNRGGDGGGGGWGGEPAFISVHFLCLLYVLCFVKNKMLFRKSIKK